jgi:putative Mg2+ transporter-C (MgtC) family protein
MWQELLGARHFEILPNLIALAVAYALAFPIGWNREHQDRSAGLRTFPLVAVAACGFIQAAEPLIAAEPGAMARVVEGVITGMGFIGGGAILQTRDSVKGTATAASLWVTGAIGVAVGLGNVGIAIVLSAITFVTLWALSDVKDKIAPDEQSSKAESE